MRTILLIIVLLASYVAHSQDVISLRDGRHIDCKITVVDSTHIYYDFVNGDRVISSYMEKNRVISYQTSLSDKEKIGSGENEPQQKVVVLGNSDYVEETFQWNNLITYSQRYGLRAKGWSIQYYGYGIKSTSNWSIPMIVGFEIFDIYPGYFSQLDYESMNLGYAKVGISPFYKLHESILINLDLQALFGQEYLTNLHGQESSSLVFGIAPSQGIYFVSKTKYGLVAGMSVYERLLSSEVYKSDIGIRLEIGIKF